VEPVRSGGRAGDGGAAGGTVMSGWRKLNYWINPRARRAEERDIQEELESLRQLAEPGELGNLTIAAEDARSQFGRLWFERLGQDLRYALRSMRHHKAFTTVVVASLALGIGANTAIYSFMEAIVFRPLPVQDPGSLVVMKWRAKTYTLARSGMMWSTNGSSSDKTTGTISSIFPYPALGVFHEQRDVLSSAFGYFSASRLALTAQGETEAVKGQFVSGGYFDGMGVVPAAGRLVQPADDTPGTSAVAVLSERFSLRRFGTPEAAVGQTVRVNDKPFAVIGVAPAAFFGAEPGAIPDVYIPLHADSLLTPGPNTNSKYLDDHLYWLEIMGRLQPGVSVAQAQAVLAPPFHQYASATTRRPARAQPAAWRQRSRQPAPPVRAADLHPDGDGWIDPARRLLEHRQPAALTCGGPAAGDCHPPWHWRESRSSRAAAPDGEPDARVNRRRAGVRGRLLGHPRADGVALQRP
jgi:hypothetical protein